MTNTDNAICSMQIEMLNATSSSLKFEWWNSQEAALFLKVSVNVLRNMTSNGEIPYYKLGNRNRYRSDELHSLLLKKKRGVRL